ncbi:MAG: transcriptional repressor LexA [Candidatus Caenarcaniphilales bacterium]|jgi:repressor LexA|nr:transcriptional repressor LexA [Candidatus Caenarcaniphilales bacterium]
MSTVLSPKQEETAEVIYRLTNKFNFPPTLDEIAAEMGITKGTLQYHMSALKKKSAITWNPGSARSVRIVDMSVVGHCQEKFPNIVKDNYGISYKSQQDNSEFSSGTRSIPILGKIAAGQPFTVMDETDEYLELDSYFADGCYALRVKGESMIDAFICDGDLVLVEPRDIPRNGEIVVALINDESATLKRYFHEGDRIRLQPENPTMQAIYVDPSKQKLRVQGVVKGIVRKV